MLAYDLATYSSPCTYTRGKYIANMDLYSMSLAELMDFPWTCGCQDQPGGKKVLKYEIIREMLQYQGDNVCASLGFHLHKIKNNISGRHNAVLIYAPEGSTGKTTCVNAVYATVADDMIFQPSYKSGFVFAGWSSFRNRLVCSTCRRAARCLQLGCYFLEMLLSSHRHGRICRSDLRPRALALSTSFPTA